jgi:class 3 adenylate cyclase/predicted ATPase
MDVAAWLRNLGLERYAAAFRDNEIDWNALPKLTAEDLKDLGVVLGSHRRRLLDAIAEFGAAGFSAMTAASRDIATRADAERRQLTVVFCDLVGSTALATRLDPEDLREVIAAYHSTVAEAVAAFGGFVAKYMGDGVLVYFGYPRAHEDDVERAVGAGLVCIKAVDRLDIKSVKLQARIGIATGLVVVGDLIGEGSAQEQSVVGETPNLAARLQSMTEPGALIIAESTRRQIGALFDLEDLGARPVTGFAEAQRAWRVLGESGVISRFEALRSETTPLIGRNEELDLLRRRWQQATAGDGRVVLISGEPGIGKSRLTAALSHRIAGEPHTRLRYFCSPHHQDSALRPFIAQLERAIGFERDDTVEQKLGKLRALLAPDARGGDEIELLAELLSLPNSAADLALSPQRKRERLFEGLLHRLEALASNRPVLMVFEDAHWIDPSSRELLDLTLDRVSRMRVLLVVTFRPEFRHSWSDQPHATMLTLNRLDGRDGAALVERLAGNAGLPRETVDEIVARADGVPLFVEELTKAVLESGEPVGRVAAVLAASPLPGLAIPATLHASLIARFDRLGPLAKEVAQIGAVLGREFDYDLIAQVMQRSAAELRLGLDRLAEAGLLFCRGVPPHASYLFKHALVQDAAYGTLLRTRRQELHARAAAALERHFVDLVERQPELLAHHLTTAGRSAEALVYWRRAGEQAIRRTANREASEYLRRALAMLEGQPESAQRCREELAILTRLTPALMSIYGWSAPEVGDAVERAAAVGRRLESSADLAPSIANLWLYNISRARLDRAEEISSDLFRIARELEDSDIRLQAHHCAWPALWHRGLFAQASEHIDAALGLYGEERHAHHRNLYLGHDPAVCGLAINASIQYALGKPGRISSLEREAIALARRLQHPPTMALGLWFVCEARAARSEREGLASIVAELLELSEEQELPQPRANALVFLGWDMAHCGAAKQGVTKITEGLNLLSKIGVQIYLTRSLCLLAEALLAAGRASEGLTHVARALDAATEFGDAFYVSRLHQVRAELLLHAGYRANEAAASLEQALAVARQQGAKGLELRSATSLARLWGERGRKTEARDLLAPVYGWFTEGFETQDLKEAKALLDQLV